MTLREMKIIMNKELRLLVDTAKFFYTNKLRAKIHEDRSFYMRMCDEYEIKAHEVSRLMYKLRFITYTEYEQITNFITTKIYEDIRK